MRWILALILAVPAFGQNGAATFPGGGGGVGVGAANVTATCAGTVTTCPVTITTLGLTSATQNTAIVNCYSSSNGQSLAISTLAFSGGPPLTTATPGFSSTTGVYCTVNSNGGAGAAGTNGAITTLQVNGTGVTTPATTNLKTGATANSGLTVTTTNPSAGNVEFNITGTPALAATAITSGTLPVARGGTGVVLAQGTGTKVQLSTGTTTTDDCVKFDANGNTVDAGAACGSGSGGSGTVTVVSSGSLTSTAIVTGGGTTTLQTICATCTLDSSGNMSLAGALVLGSGPAVTGTGILGITESTGQACAAAADCLIADSSSHRLKVSNNNGTAAQVVQSGVDINTSDQVTVTHLASALPVLQGGTGVTTSTGTGAVVLGTGPTITLPNATGLPLTTGVTGTLPVANGGTGVTASQGNGTKNQLSTGTTTTNDCVKFDANGNTVDAGSACGAGGGATIASTTSAIKGDGAGNGVAVTGTGSNCVHVDGSSAACSGAATDINAIRDAIYVQGTGTNSITGTTTTTFASYSAGQTIRLCMAAAANTTATQININSIGPVAITKNGGTALSGGELAASQCYLMTYRTATPSFDMTVSTGSGSPGGSTTQLQYNNAGSFAGMSGHTFDGTNTETMGASQVIDYGTNNGQMTNLVQAAVFGATSTDELCAATGGSGSGACTAGSGIVVSGTTETPFQRTLQLSANKPGVGRGLIWTLGGNFEGTASPSVTYRLKACATANYTAATGACSSGGVTLWTSTAGNLTQTSTFISNGSQQFLIECSVSGTLNVLPIATTKPFNVTAVSSASSPIQTSGVPMTSAWTLYMTAQYSTATSGNWVSLDVSYATWWN